MEPVFTSDKGPDGEWILVVLGIILMIALPLMGTCEKNHGSMVESTTKDSGK